jgi:hypothetical protein
MSQSIESSIHALSSASTGHLGLNQFIDDLSRILAFQNAPATLINGGLTAS